MMVAWQRGMCKSQSGHGANIGCISYNTHAFIHGRRLGGYTFEARISERIESVVVEVGVHRSVVVVHGRRGSSCTRVGEELDESEVFGVVGRGT